MVLNAFLGLLICACLPERHAFVTRCMGKDLVRCKMSNDDSSEELRRILEASWNAEAMGCVPTSAESAAQAAASSLFEALDKKEQMFMIDLLLPQYDITYGSRLYDEVRAVEFCIALAERLERTTQILVRDSKTVDTVNRVLAARERDAASVETYTDDDLDEADESENAIEFYDDFADFGLVGENPSNSGDDDDSQLLSFREKLQSKWDGNGSDASFSSKKDTNEKMKASPARQFATKCYRLASLFGDKTISSSSDMHDDVIAALSENGKPNDDEDIMIILSACTKEEMLAVRALTTTYGTQKTMIFVNCKFDTLPRELRKAKMAYSILPLIAKPTSSPINLFGNTKNDVVQPRVVILRRYPRDWEVYVDIGKGFELGATVPARQVGNKGPTMEWIATAVKRYLQNRIA